MNSEATIAIPPACRKNANSTMLIVAFEGEDHRERDELTKDLAGSDRKDMVSQRPKERTTNIVKTGNSLCITCRALRFDFAFQQACLKYIH
jgi:hypothetical protein